jgi:hypothetical protein
MFKSGKALGFIGRILLFIVLAISFLGLNPLAVLAAANMTATFTPAANAMNVALNSNIVVTFSANINSSSVSDTTFKVDGSFSGRIAGAYNTNNAIVTFNPTADFKPGETVTVTLTSGIKSVGGDTLTGPVTFQFTAAAQSGVPNFTSTINFGTSGNHPRAAALADFNGDGKLDIAMGNDGGQNAVYINDGTGADWTTHYNFGPGNDQTCAIAVGDFNGDGHPDLAVGNNGG